MNKDYVVVVAHPDDEIIFFSSVLEHASKIIICFSSSSNIKVTEGRKRLRNRLPLNRLKWLNLREANTFLAANWKTPNSSGQGLSVNRNSEAYTENHEILKKALRNDIENSSRVYTHNPWGEYGHEEHVQVLQAVLDLSKNIDNEIYVSGYVSDRSFNLFRNEEYRLEDKIEIKKVPKDLCNEIKNVYISNQCWTWFDDYEWPKIEIFTLVNKSSDSTKVTTIKSSAHHPFILLTMKFKQNWPKALVSKTFPKPMKVFIKRLLGKSL